MMKNCQNCLEKNWKYEFIDGWIRAICNVCGYEIEFMSRKLKKKTAAQKTIKTVDNA